jgi:hypothetical protein
MSNFINKKLPKIKKPNLFTLLAGVFNDCAQQFFFEPDEDFRSQLQQYNIRFSKSGINLIAQWLTKLL